MTFKLKKNIKIDKASLNVKDLDLLVDFYTNKIGFDLIKVENNMALLGVGEKAILELVQVEREANKKTTGLYHIAFLLPTRADLANALFSLKERQAPLYGFADHGYSEALYLKDPEGNGIEIYADKDKEEWDIREDGRIVGYTRLLDREKLLEEKTSDKPINLAEGTKVGHIHLSIRDLGEAKDFYTNILGLDNKFELAGQAVFMASGLYHHQVAINSWDRVNMDLREDGDLGLNYFEIIIEDKEDFDRLRRNFKENNIHIQEIKTGLLAKDNQNIRIIIKHQGFLIY